MRRSDWKGWAPWCAALLLALLALSLLHTVSPHAGARGDCTTCKALRSPLITHSFDTLAVPVACAAALDPRPLDRPLSIDARRLSLLRGPPAA